MCVTECECECECVFEYFPGRIMSQLRGQLKRGFYGCDKRDGGTHTGIDGCMVRTFIQHTHKYINECIRESTKLKNSGIECVL